jgi:hypothetical protein
MKRLLLAVLLLFSTQAAWAYCTTETVIWYQVAEYSDGTKSTTILSIEEYTWCDVAADPLPPDAYVGGPTYTTPPSVSMSFVDTTDPYNPIVGIDVSSNDDSDPTSWVILEVSGTTVDYTGFSGNGQYRLALGTIGDFGDGNTGINAKACTEYGVCGNDSQSVSRSTPSPNEAAKDISASWQEEEEEGPVTHSAAYGHTLRQVYTTTNFTCSELGENSHFQIKDSLVTISGQDPMPWWNASISTSGTINNASYGLSDSENPVGCTYPVLCSSKSGSSSGTFGYLPSVHEGITDFVIDGQGSIFTNGTLDINFY